MTGERFLDAYGRRWYRLANGVLAPSVTTVLDLFPKPALAAWRANRGDEADRIAEEAAERGTRIHAGFEALLLHRSLPDDLAADELEVIDRLREWIAARRPTGVEAEKSITGHVVSEDGRDLYYSGTLDLLAARIGERRCVVDLKTGSGPFIGQEAQIAAYSAALTPPAEGGILLFADVHGTREVEVDLSRGWRRFRAALVLFHELHVAPCDVRLVA